MNSGPACVITPALLSVSLKMHRVEPWPCVSQSKLGGVGSNKQRIFTYDAMYNRSFSNMEASPRRVELVYQSTVR